MKAIQIREFGDVNAIRLADVDKPDRPAGQLLVQVAFSAINPSDWKLTTGHLQAFVPVDLPLVLGNEIAGIVVGCPDGDGEFKVGDRVHGITSQYHGHAEYALLDPASATKVPDSMPLDVAAALPMGAVTAGEILDKAGLGGGTRLLVQGASGAVGRAAVQIGKALGATVTAVTSQSGSAFVASLPADNTVLREEAYEAGIGLFDVVLDCAGPEALRRSWGLVRPGGQLISITAHPDQSLAATHGISARFDFGVPATRHLDRVNAMWSRGDFQPKSIRIVPFEAAAEAIWQVGTGQAPDKVLLAVANPPAH